MPSLIHSAANTPTITFDNGSFHKMAVIITRIKAVAVAQVDIVILYQFCVPYIAFHMESRPML